MEKFLTPLPMVYTFRNCSWFVWKNVDDFKNRNTFWLLLLKQGYRYHKLCKAFSKFYYRHSDLIVKYNISLKTLLQQGITEHVFYVDLVYKFKRIVGSLIIVINLKIVLNVIKEWDTTWISCGGLHAWL